MRKRILFLSIGLVAALGWACSSATAPCTPEPEVCDNYDNDCNGAVDDNPTDVSGDACGTALGECSQGVETCVEGEVVCQGAVEPVAEVCNGLDDNCDGETDENFGCTGADLTEACVGVGACGAGTCECMADGSAAQCSTDPGGSQDQAQVESCNNSDDDCDGTVDDGLTDCACTGGNPPLADELCNGIDDDCDGTRDEGLSACACADDGQAQAETCNGIDDDCNETIDDVANCACTGGNPPAANELCNGIDDDCNGVIDDGLTACGCTDGNPPAAAEVCNGIDDDCNQLVDDGLSNCACSGGNPPAAAEICNGIDDDCNDAVDDTLTDCACTGGNPPQAAELCNGIDDDCNGTVDDLANCACTGGSPPQASETCNGIDDDCNEGIDDGLSNCACTGGNPPAANEACNGVDDDCNGAIDDGLTACACTGGNPPQASETCNGVDDDCDELIDEDNGQGGGCGDLGDPCNTYLDCISQVCVGDSFFRYCSEDCASDGSIVCPSGYRCFVGSNGDYCLMNFTACDSDDDCAAENMVCTVQDSDDGLGKVSECRPPLTPGAAPGEACATAGDCQNAICTRAGVCGEICSVAAPCSDTYLGEATGCITSAYWVLPGSCSRDEQCPPSYTCESNSCRGPTCTQDSDCATGYGCQDPDDTGPLGLLCIPVYQVDRVGTCQVFCDGDGDCPVDPVGDQLYCLAGVQADLSAVQGYCRPLYTGNQVGQTCDPSCDHGMCIRGTVDYCTKVCGDATDCPPTWNCTAGTWDFGDLGLFPDTTSCTMP